MKSKVSKILPNEDGSGSSSDVGSVVVEDGPTLPADFVIMGVGVGPATDFLKDSGFALEKDGGIMVDEYLRAKGVEDVYAVGAYNLLVAFQP